MTVHSDPSVESSDKKSLVKAAGLLGGMTLLSRILGLARDMVSAHRYGTSWQWDAFLYAFTLPNFFRRIVGEGALASAFIPVYTQILNERGKEAAFRYANAIGTLVAIGLTSFLLAVELALTFALNHYSFPERLALMLDLLRYFFPYLWLISIFALGMGILNCHRHFFAPSLGSIILDIFWIVGVVGVVPFLGAGWAAELRWLAVILLISALVQVAVEWPPLAKIGFRYGWVFRGAEAGVKKTASLFLPSLLSFAVVQINILVDSSLAYLCGPGANSSLWYGNRIMQFPLGVFAIAMGTALLPTLSHQSARKEFDEAKKTLSFALRTIFLIILPCTAGLMVLGSPIVKLLFERGEFDAVSTARSAAVLAAYSIGLFAYSGQKIVTTGFFASQETRTPFKIGIVALAANIVFILLLIGPMKEAGLALATSLSGILQFLLLIYFYNRKISSFPYREVVVSFLKISLATLGMSAVAWASFAGLGRFLSGESTLAFFIQVFGCILLSAVSYLILCALLRVSELKEVWQWLRRRK